MIAAALGLSLVLLGPGESAEAPAPAQGAPAAAPAFTLRPSYDPERRARQAFIAGYTLMGLTLISETTGAIISTLCQPGDPCDLGLTYSWGSDRAGTRYTVISSGTGSAYVLGRGVGITLITVAKGLMAFGGQAQGMVDAQAGRPRPVERRVAIAMLATGLPLWALSRLARLGFVLGGVCQQPGCLYTFDQLTLGASRGLNFAGSTLLAHHDTHARVQLSVAPMGPWGLALAGRF